MGIIADALTTADHATFTTPIPKTVGARVRFLLKQHQRSVTRTAAALGISPTSVRRYARDERKHPPADIAHRIEQQVLARWQPHVRARARRQAATTGGVTVETRARFGYTAAPGSTDDPRLRRITQHLPATYAAALFEAQAAGAPETELRQIVAAGLQEAYFKEGGLRAQDLVVELQDIDYLDLAY